MGIGDKLQKLISQKNTNVNELSINAKVSPSTLYSIIKRNNTKVDIDVLIRISNILGVPVEFFSDETCLNSCSQLDNPQTKKVPKDLKKILEDEEVTLNGRMMSDEDKEKMMRIIEAAFYEAKEMNKRKQAVI